MSAIQAVIFDLDDTLYPERDYAYSGFAVVATAFEEQLGDPTESTARMNALLDADRRGRVFNALLDELGRPDDDALIVRMIETFRTHKPGIELFPDADAALTRFRGAFRLGLITDGPAVQQSAKVDALDLRTRIDELVLTAELGSGFGKPHPAAFDLMQEHFDLPPSACIYVADNAAKDFVAPNALGWKTVQIPRIGGIYHGILPPEGGAPQHMASSLDELDALLR